MACANRTERQTGGKRRLLPTRGLLSDTDKRINEKPHRIGGKVALYQLSYVRKGFLP